MDAPILLKVYSKICVFENKSKSIRMKAGMSTQVSRNICEYLALVDPFPNIMYGKALGFVVESLNYTNENKCRCSYCHRCALR